jgi:glycosyltransferase involved in cell wall biosynthesis
VSFDCVAGPSEIITDGTDGLLVEDQNLEQMEAAILKLIEDPSLREALARNAMANVQRFTKEVITDRWLALIEKTITQQNRSTEAK